VTTSPGRRERPEGEEVSATVFISEKHIKFQTALAELYAHTTAKQYMLFDLIVRRYMFVGLASKTGLIAE